MSIVVVAAPGLFSVVLYTPDGISINGLVTHLLLPTAGLLIMLLIVLLAKRTEAAGKLDLTLASPRLVRSRGGARVARRCSGVGPSDDRGGQFFGAEVASRPHVLGRRQACHVLRGVDHLHSCGGPHHGRAVLAGIRPARSNG